jgi:hypothetical protein
VLAVDSGSAEAFHDALLFLGTQFNAWPLGILAIPPSAIGVAAEQVAVGAEHGDAPATSPLSYRQLNAIHGPRLKG